MLWLINIQSSYSVRVKGLIDMSKQQTDKSRIVTKPTKWHVRPAKTQISLGIRPVWSESSLCAQWVAKDPSFLQADSEDSDQTGRMPRLIWVFAGRTCRFVRFVTMRLINQDAILRRNKISTQQQDQHWMNPDGPGQRQGIEPQQTRLNYLGRSFIESVARPAGCN